MTPWTVACPSSEVGCHFLLQGMSMEAATPEEAEAKCMVVGLCPFGGINKLGSNTLKKKCPLTCKFHIGPTCPR